MSTIVITGGTGSFGNAMTRHLLETTAHNVRVLSRDEHKQEKMSIEFPPSSRMTYVLCDVRDLDRLQLAFHGADTVIHAAANKIVGSGEIHTVEFVKTNVFGTMNVARACIDNKVKRALLISSDKAVSSANLYGKSKAVAESIFTTSNMYGHGCKFASVRGGNIWHSRGSVIEKWLSNPDHNIKVYGDQTTRFHLLMSDWLEFCLRSIHNTHGGEIFIPKCDAWSLHDLADAFFEVFHDSKVDFLPSRRGDKAQETLISEHEFSSSIDLDWGYVIEPSDEVRQVWNYVPHVGKQVTSAVSSDMVRRMGISELRSLISRTINNVE